ncbi:uncharacterized protein [Solanum lycopersicum]|uniref:uncharacterized protein n=1 Tax=Solanum lycopersicum TaxID=4081 RepID=UPI003749F904
MCGQGNGGHQISRGGEQAGATAAQHGGGNGQTDNRAHCYSFPGKPEVEPSDVVIIGNLLVCDCMASVLFNPGSIFSYVYYSFDTSLDLYCDLLDMPICVSTLVGESVIVEKVYRSCLVTFVGSNTHVDLIILEMVDFDVILGMTWLSLNIAILDCNAKIVTLAKPGKDPLVWEGDYISTPIHIISFHRAKRLVSKGCLAFLAHLRDDISQVTSIESVSIVREFLDVLPADLPCMSPDMDIDFCIDQEPGSRPISIPPYGMVPADLRELKAQHQELLGKGFIRPSASPWGSPDLFVKKKDGSFRMCIDYRQLHKNLKTLLTTAPIVALQVEGKANVVADALSRKAGSMGSLSHIQVTRCPLSTEVQTLDIDFIRLEVLEKGGFLACVEDNFLPLEEFSYNNSDQSSINMAPFEALYGRRCRSPIGWFDAFEVTTWGTDLLGELLDKVKIFKEKLLAAQNRQKEYADRKVRDLDSMEGEQVLLKVSPMKWVMQFGRQGKLSLRYIGPFEVLKHVGEVFYELALPPGLSGVHPIFHEPVAILDGEVRKLRSNEIASVKVQWKNRPVEESTWKNEADMQERYPHLLTDSGYLSKVDCGDFERRNAEETTYGADDGLPSKDPHAHIAKVQAVSKSCLGKPDLDLDVIGLRVFPLSLTGEAAMWFTELP